MRAILLPLLCVLSLSACAGSTPPAESPSETPAASASAASTPAAPDAPAKPLPSATASADAKPAAPPEASPKADASPKQSAWQIDGVSVSDLTAAQLEAALKKRGWPGKAIGETKHGKYEMFGFLVKKGADVINVGIARTAKTPGPVDATTNEAAFSPEALEKLYSTNEGISLARDPEAQVLVTALAMGKRANHKGAAKLFEDLLQRPK
ncbi:Hypothetical protein A7982_07255 [Minicystis rosea]|nr:Hypothetical protein A7982_07255 [Minicystis rosea]